MKKNNFLEKVYPFIKRDLSYYQLPKNDNKKIDEVCVDQEKALDFFIYSVYLIKKV